MPTSPRTVLHSAYLAHIMLMNPIQANAATVSFSQYEQLVERITAMRLDTAAVVVAPVGAVAPVVAPVVAIAPVVAWLVGQVSIIDLPDTRDTTFDAQLGGFAARIEINCDTWHDKPTTDEMWERMIRFVCVHSKIHGNDAAYAISIPPPSVNTMIAFLSCARGELVIRGYTSASLHDFAMSGEQSGVADAMRHTHVRVYIALECIDATNQYARQRDMISTRMNAPWIKSMYIELTVQPDSSQSTKHWNRQQAVQWFERVATTMRYEYDMHLSFRFVEACDE